ncbi:MAG: YdcF family protein [Sneathiella sp.]|nr:YdcF family protein [Sneathiella sp.]
MLDYALERLVDGISLPGIVLILLPIALLHWWFTKKRWVLAPVSLFFVVMSLPVTGKLLLYPLEIGIPFKDVKADSLKGKIDAIAVISSGLHHDYLTGASVPNTTSFSRVKRAELLALQLNIPLILSGTIQTDGDKTDAEVLAGLVKDREGLLLISGATGTSDHAKNVQRITEGSNINRLAVFVSGIHAYRTEAVFKNVGFDVPIVIVGLRDSVFGKKDIIPSFIGFFYWKHALKEYAGLVHYYMNGKIS